MQISQELFEKNLAVFQTSNPRLVEGKDFDLSSALQKRDQSDPQAELENWRNSLQKSTLKYPNQMVRDDEYAKDLVRRYNQFQIGGDISQYYDLPACDPHLVLLLLDLRNAVIDSGFDITDNTRVLDPPHNSLICFGTGDGRALATLLDYAQPHNLYIVVEDTWDDYISSFWTIDWLNLWNLFSEPRRITIIRCKSPAELRTKIANEALLNIEQALTFTPQASSQKLKEFAEEMNDIRTSHMINYLGFTVDELNMIINSVDTLKRQPKIFNPPPKNTSASFIVCGSGPSLDTSIDAIKKLSSSHVIIASGSNYQTLLANGIEADFLCLNERSLDTYDDFKKTYDRYGRTKTKLIMSSTCAHQLLDLFDEVAIFFRPALTPLSVFSDSPFEVLQFEGPEAVNTGVSIACHLGASKIVLFGVDLGSVSQDKLRSEDACGMTPRVFDIESEGNLSETVYTSSVLKDVAMMLNDCVLAFKAINKFDTYNCSDGVKLESFEPKSSAEYLAISKKSIASDSKQKSMVNNWWNELPIYTNDRLSASWQSRNPRNSTFQLSKELIDLLKSDKPWFPEITRELTSILSLNRSLETQFPRRIMHSTLYKASVAITQQFLAMSHKDSDKELRLFGSKAKDIMISYIQKMENEIYQLCNYCKI